MFLVAVMFSFVNISQRIGWEGWVFCTSREISRYEQYVKRDVKLYKLPSIWSGKSTTSVSEVYVQTVDLFTSAVCVCVMVQLTDLFQKLFRQDLLVASLFRNFLLAERIMRSYNCTPVSSPKLPPTFQHPMWSVLALRDAVLWCRLCSRT